MLAMRLKTGARHWSTEKAELWALGATSRSEMSMLGGIRWGCMKEAEAHATGKLQVASQTLNIYLRRVREEDLPE